MAIGRPRYYWDSAPLIAWITDEKRDDPSEMAGLAEVIELVDSNRAIIMTSVLWRAEVLDSSLTPTQKKRVESVFDGRSIIELSIDSRVMSLAGEIRSVQSIARRKDVAKNIRVPDAIHLASAIHFDATEFHTFDGARKGNAGSLLTLNGNVAGRNLKICTPRGNQYRLALVESAGDDADEAEAAPG